MWPRGGPSATNNQKSERLIKRLQTIDLGLDPKSGAYYLLNVTKFGRGIMSHFTIPYIFAILYSPEDVKMDQRINFKSMLKQYDRTVESIYISSYDSQYYKYFAQYLDFVPSEKIVGTVLLLEGFKQQTIKTKWVTAEVDRITALIYFMIIILVFIVAILILPDLLHKFAQVFGDIYLIRLGVLTVYNLQSLYAII